MPTKSAAAIHFPPPLKPGGTIGIVSPASWSSPDALARAREVLENRGYQVVVHAQNYLKEGRLAGSDAARTEAIMDMFADATIDAIICARGDVGGSLRILDRLDYKLIKKNPKPFVGFSDITALLHAITKSCGFVTFHGPVSLWLTPEYDPKTLDDMLTAIGPGKRPHKMHYGDVNVLHPGSAAGRLIGGNLTLLQNLIGTPYDWWAKDAILFIEDVDEALYKIDRTLHHLRLAGKFDGIRALLIGEMTNITDGEPGKPEKSFGRSLQRIITDIMPPHIPIGMNFPCGHGKYLTTLPLGVEASLKLDAQNAELIFGNT